MIKQILPLPPLFLLAQYPVFETFLVARHSVVTLSDTVVITNILCFHNERNQLRLGLIANAGCPGKAGPSTYPAF